MRAAPLPVRVLATNHTSFTVSDLDRTIAFFREVLGFELLSKAPRDPRAIAQITGVEDPEVMIAFLQAPGHRLELIQYIRAKDAGAVAPRPCDVGFSHVAFDIDDLDAALAAAAAHGVEPIGAPYVIDQGPNKGCRVAYLRDRDRITIEFIEKRASA